MNTQQVSTKLQALLDQLVSGDKLVQSAVMGLYHGDSAFTWSGAAGYADANRRAPMTAQTPFCLASISKTYTAAALMLLEERGKLQLGDRIGRYLPRELTQGIHRFKGTEYTDSLTLRHLVTHTSGLADYSVDKPKGGKSLFERLFNEGDRAFDLEYVMRLNREELPPKFAPATPDPTTGHHLNAKAHYSDTNFRLLGAILEQVAEKPLHELYEELLFEPLGLTETYLYGHPRGSALGAPATLFHGPKPLNIPLALQSTSAQGGMVSTVSDTLRFLRALVQGELFARPETFPSMQHWNKIYFPMQYGYGLMKFHVPRLLSPFSPSPVLVGHSGSTGSFLYYSAEKNIYLSGTVNQNMRFRAPFALMLKAIQIIERARA